MSDQTKPEGRALFANDPEFYRQFAAACIMMPSTAVKGRLGPIRDKQGELYGWDFLVGRAAIKQARTLDYMIGKDESYREEKQAERATQGEADDGPIEDTPF